MFELNQDFKVAPSKVILLEADGRALRRVRFKLERDFDDALADAVGVVGKKAREMVEKRGATKVVIPIDAMHGEMVLKAGDESVTVSVADGFKMVARAGKVPKNEDAEEEPPQLKLEFDAGMEDALWAFLGRHAGEQVRITYKNAQLSLALDGEGGGKRSVTLTPEAKPATAKRGRKAGKPAGQPPAEDPEDPQQAATPEEAEEVRAQRLREERSESEGAWTS
jgi:hypothetical protein